MAYAHSARDSRFRGNAGMGVVAQVITQAKGVPGYTIGIPIPLPRPDGGKSQGQM